MVIRFDQTDCSRARLSLSAGFLAAWRPALVTRQTKKVKRFGSSADEPNRKSGRSGLATVQILPLRPLRADAAAHVSRASLPALSAPRAF